MASRVVIRNTFLDIVESSEGGGPAHRPAPGLRRTSSAPAGPLPGRCGPGEARASATHRAAAAAQLERLNGALRAEGPPRQGGGGSAAAGDGRAAAALPRWPSSGGPLAGCPTSDELLAWRLQLGLAPGEAEQVSSLKPSGSQSTLAPPDSASECGSGAVECMPEFAPSSLDGSTDVPGSPASWTSSAKTSGTCEAPCTKMYAQLQDGLAKLLAAEVSDQGRQVDMRGQVNRAPIRKGATQMDSFTTVMVGHIPGRYRANELQRELEGVGFLGTIDFIYLPASKVGGFSAGYAFVNFVSCAWARRALEVLDGYSFKKHQGNQTRVACTSIARIQGLRANIQHRNKAWARTTRGKQLRGNTESAVLESAAKARTHLLGGTSPCCPAHLLG